MKMIGQTVGSWVLESKLGEGGMGEVYLGRHQSLDTLAAVKVMSPAFSHDPKLHERFSREAKTQAQLRHPNIAQVLDHVEKDGRWFLVVEYLPSGTLEDAITQREEPLPVAQALAWARQGLAGLHHAHERGIVHRDIKPANLLINERGEAAVTDFGIALEAGARRLTQTGTAIGTPEYMSPEQIRGAEDLDRRTDVYSMGVVLYELLAQRVPFQAESMFEVQRAQVSDPPPPLRSVAPSVPADLEAIVMRALAKTPEERYATCADFAADLEAFERGESPAAPAPAPQRRRTVLEGAAPDLPTPPPSLSPSSTAQVPSGGGSPGARRKATMAVPSPASAAPSPSPALSSPPPRRRRASRWPLVAAVLIGAVVLAALFGPWKSGGGGGGGGASGLEADVEKIEALDAEAQVAAQAAAQASMEAQAAAAEAGSAAQKSQQAAQGLSCSLAATHAGTCAGHAGVSKEAAERSAAEAEKAQVAASRAAELAEGLEDDPSGEASGASAWRQVPRWILSELSGVAYADVESDAALHRRGVEASERADEAARRSADDAKTAGAAAEDASRAAAGAEQAAESCAAGAKGGNRPPPGVVPGQGGMQPPPGVVPGQGGMQPPPGVVPGQGGMQPPPGVVPGQGGMQPPPGFAGKVPPGLPDPRTLPASPVVAVLAVGDPLMAASLEAVVEKRLLRGGFDVRDEMNSFELAELVDRKGPDVSMSEIAPILVREGFHVVVLVKVEEGARRRVRAAGQELSGVAARLSLNAHRLLKPRPIGRGWSERVEYTELSAEAKAKQAFIGPIAELVPAIREDWKSFRRGG